MGILDGVFSVLDFLAVRISASHPFNARVSMASTLASSSTMSIFFMIALRIGFEHHNSKMQTASHRFYRAAIIDRYLILYSI